MLNARSIDCHCNFKEVEDPGACSGWTGSRSCWCFRRSGNGWTRSRGPNGLWSPAAEDSSPLKKKLKLNQTGCNLTPISRHPVAAVTAWPVAVLAVGHLVLLQLMLHLLLDLDDLPECVWRRTCHMQSKSKTWGTATNGSWRDKQDLSQRLVSGNKFQF